MPMYMDIHEIQGATAEAVAKAHLADMETQKKYGVEYHKYWFNESTGKISCLCSAPTSEAAARVHGEAHGLLASKIIEVAVEDHMDLFGSTVQLAARLCAHAQPAQSLVSNVVCELCIGKGLAFQDLGEVSFKGFDRPIRIHAIQ